MKQATPEEIAKTMRQAKPPPLPRKKTRSKNRIVIHSFEQYLQFCMVTGLNSQHQN